MLFCAFFDIFSYLVTISINNVYLYPIGGFNESYLEVSQALRAARKAARQTFNYEWDINIEL